jgi:hypothetical protein
LEYICAQGVGWNVNFCQLFLAQFSVLSSQFSESQKTAGGFFFSSEFSLVVAHAKATAEEAQMFAGDRLGLLRTDN